MLRGAFILASFSLFLPTVGFAQSNLDNPLPGSFQSGIGFVSGWKCTAGSLTFTIDNGPAAPLASGISRNDTQGQCGDSNNGFIAEENWNLVSEGQHTIRVFDNGVQFAQATFTVATLGTEFLQGVEKEQIVTEFPNLDTTTFLQWQESAQNFVIQAAIPNAAFPDLHGVYQVTGSETRTGCTSPTNNGTFAYQGQFPLAFQVGPDFRGSAVLQSTASGNFATAAITGEVLLSGHMTAMVITDSYTGGGSYLGNEEVVFSGTVSGTGFSGTYSGHIVTGETCSVSGSLSGVRS